MNDKSRTILGLIGSLLLLLLGIYRIISNNLAEMSLFVGYIFAIAGFIGIIAFSVKMYKVART